MKKQTIITLSLISTAIVIVAVFIILNKESSDSVSNGLQTIDKNLLVGNWVRTDASYLVKILKVNEDRTLEAQYFNPNPINVGKANWEESNGNLKIIIELRDVNYPGSTYTLNYLPDRDMLAGDYYQAVEGIIFYVEFARNE